MQPVSKYGVEANLGRLPHAEQGPPDETMKPPRKNTQRKAMETMVKGFPKKTPNLMERQRSSYRLDVIDIGFAGSQYI